LNDKPLYFNDDSFKDTNDNTVTISKTTLGIGNVYLDRIYVKSRNTDLTTIISSYEITSSTTTSSLSYSPILTQSLSLSQSIFNI
jgi:hypothetical protein